VGGFDGASGHSRRFERDVGTTASPLVWGSRCQARSQPHAPLSTSLYDDDATPLWPELMERLDGTKRHGTLIVTRDRVDRRREVHLPWQERHFRDRVSDIRAAAGIAPVAKFMGLRHGGNTEGANADLTDAQLRALGGHKTAAMTILYARETMKQRKIGARKRLKQRTKQDNLSAHKDSNLDPLIKSQKGRSGSSNHLSEASRLSE
jgi:hypothetical protein